MVKATSIISFLKKICLVLICALPLATPLVVWATPTFGVGATSAWKEALLLVTIPFLLILAKLETKKARRLLAERDVQVALVLILLYCLYAGIFWRGQETLAGLSLGARFLYAYILGRVISVYDGAFVRKAVKALVVVSVLVGVIAVLMTTILPKDILTNIGYDPIGVNTKGIPPAYHVIAGNEDFIRAQGTLRGPNVLGAFLLLPLSIVIAWAVSDKRFKNNRTLVIGLTSLFLLALGLSYSRSAWIGLGVVLITIGLIRSGKYLRNVAFGLIILALFSMSFLAIFKDHSTFRTLILHGSPETGQSVSNTDHLRLSVEGAKDVLSEPLGNGPGSAGPASALVQSGDAKVAENYFLQVGQEVGLLGLLLMVVLHILVGIKLYRGRTQVLNLGLFAALLGLTITNLLLHTWSDEVVGLIFWLLAGLAIIGTESEHDDKKRTPAKI